MFSNILRGLFGGAIGLSANFVLLGIADYFGVVTARGGFQKLVKVWFGGPLGEIGAATVWGQMHLPDPSSSTFVNGFKIAVGLAFALVYIVIKPYLPGGRVARGLIYALIVWLLNAGLVLPLLGEGFAGVHTLTWLGIFAFAVAHTAFFVILALIA